VSGEGLRHEGTVPRLLNFGCGGAFHPGWVNLDACPASPGVVAHDLRQGFPYPSESFQGVYGSHVLEHLDPETGARLLRECHRVLGPGGIIRIVVPDLEAIARLYLRHLEGAAAGDVASGARYDWMMLELFDQAVRTSSGGAMAAYLAGNLDDDQRRFVASRVGDPVPRPIRAGGGRRSPAWSLERRLAAFVRAVRSGAASLCAFALLGREGAAALREGIFRRGGEVHRWMYDRFALPRALEGAGFADLRVCGPDESRIPDFGSYGLETVGGRARKPDSLYVEGMKPLAGNPGVASASGRPGRP
jgi:predicted SAM-dependent methyltransferase